jgi:hypothetical protein
MLVYFDFQGCKGTKRGRKENLKNRINTNVIAMCAVKQQSSSYGTAFPP